MHFVRPETSSNLRDSERFNEKPRSTKTANEDLLNIIMVEAIDADASLLLSPTSWVDVSQPIQREKYKE